jgi:hypothetical protein
LSDTTPALDEAFERMAAASFELPWLIANSRLALAMTIGRSMASIAVLVGGHERPVRKAFFVTEREPDATQALQYRPYCASVPLAGAGRAAVHRPTR